MSTQAGHPVPGERPSVPLARDVANEFPKLLAALARRAQWLGSRDPESAAQESLKRSLENAISRPAMEYYFGQDSPDGLEPPEWPLDRLFVWLHAVVHYVVREEKSRVGYQRELLFGAAGPVPSDPTPDQLDTVIQQELHGTLQYRGWIEGYARNHKIPILRAEKGKSKEDCVRPYLRRH